MAHILAVDDNEEVRESLERLLKLDRHEVGLAPSAADALVLLKARIPDLLILDVVMPEMDGVALCRILRSEARFVSLPILFLTARGGTDDIVAGLEAGADDYMVKPFELAELRARIAALLRRSGRDRPPQATIEHHKLRLDSHTYQVTTKGRSIQLTSTEHRLLRYLMEHLNQALSPSHLLQAVWEYPPNTGDPDLVRAHVRNLRAKVEDQENSGRIIRTIHGVGYMISSED